MPITNKDGANSTQGHVKAPSLAAKNTKGATANDGGTSQGKNSSSNEKKKGATGKTAK